MITKKIKYLLIFSMLLIIGNTTVYANNTVDFTKKGSISITLKESVEKKAIEGADITIYKIATATSKNNNLFFEFTEALSTCESDLTDLSNSNLVDEINDCLIDIDTELQNQTKKTNAQGRVTYNDLELGLYFVKQTNKVEGYSKIDSFLVAIPKEENNIWIYDIEATPKTDIIRIMDLTVEKVWNSSNKLEIHPKSITVELYKGTELIDTITLNEENNWTHTWKEIEKSDEYKVKEINIPDGYTDTYRQEENKFIITNTKTLVQTGFNNTITGLLTILGLTFIIAGIIFEKGTNHE